jgi:D-alanyl-lipoteichoic acid acyltransferase DltB (MBOAT superfamily)
MLFHTWIFLVFFVLFYTVYLLTKKSWFREPWLLVSSYVFYAWWNPLYLLLIVWSTLIDYAAVTFMERRRQRKLWLTLSILNNLFLLGFFKYGPFVTENLNLLLVRLGIPLTIPAPGVLLPVGISFYTFQSMSYTIDFYRGKIEREKSFIRFATFVSLFPQLVAGPIERAKNLLPQLRSNPAITSRDISDGLSLFIVGLFKKVALADYLALYVDRVYDVPNLHDGPALLLATFAFSWQIYFDFSGYTDMARGIGRMMGFKLMLNFNNPYLADGLGDFWKRWHISLSTWFKDYVYIPLGGNRKGKLFTYRNMVLAMLISGLWHGAAWMFIIWGALHALGRIATRELERSEFYRQKIPRIVKQVAVFSFVTFAWIFFRARSLDDAFIIISRIFDTVWTDPQFPLLMLFLVLSIWLYQFLYESKLRIILQSSAVRIAMVIGMILYLFLFAPSGNQPFIYFQF